MKTHVLMISTHFQKDHPRQGEETHFKEKILSGTKIHTIRDNYDFWEKRIKEVMSGDAILSVRQWIGKPYWSKQKTIIDLNKDSGVGIQRLISTEIFGIDIDGITDRDNLNELAAYDGLSLEDFKSWFEKSSCRPLAIIHITNFRY